MPPDAPHVTSRAHQTYRVIGATAVVLVIVAAAAVGSYFAGQSTRDSDKTVAAKVTTSVNAGVKQTVAEQTGIRRKVIREVRADQKKHDRSVMRKLRARMQKVADRKAKASYASGQSTGFSSGHSQGEQDGYQSGTVDGLIQGSDQLSCSDDIDVTWLPACGY